VLRGAFGGTDTRVCGVETPLDAFVGSTNPRFSILSQWFRCSYRLSGLAAALALLSAAAILHGQNSRTYSVGFDWWSAGRGIIFPLAEEYDNASGNVRILNSQGAVRPAGHPFFTPLGANGRACITCHQPAGAMSVAADRIRQRWTDTSGTDPIFAAIDGSNCPDLPQADRQSHSLLLNRGLFRMVLPWPPKGVQPDFRLEVVHDPTGCNTSTAVSVFRRPRMAANFKYVLANDPNFTLMTDGREPSLRSQAITAAMVHEQATAPPTSDQLDQIVAFETQLFAAQSGDVRAGLLYSPDGPSLLGPENLAAGKALLFSGAEKSLPVSMKLWHAPNPTDSVAVFRASVARGSDLFSARCAVCHQAASNRAINIGTTMRTGPTDIGDLPLFRITCDSGRILYTEDPGRALTTGKCADVGAIVMQQLRGLAARAPYFSNGSAPTLAAVVDFYDRRFAARYSATEKQDLINFLSVL
jgi:mono/diheme cytochrome c family protein